MRELKPYLDLLIARNGSDLFFSTGAPILLKVEGQIQPVEPAPLSREEVEAICLSVMSEAHRLSFARRPELNLGLSAGERGRFRVNIYRQRGTMSMAVRYLRGEIPRLEDLNLPPMLKQLVMEPRGLVLVVGGTGTGKSTALASMIDYRNESLACHIITIEDPIEYVFRYKQSLVEQREIGIDTLSYEDALSNAMRQAPDVILIGEIRDAVTMQNAIAYSETGHLCLATLHANNCNQALERIISFFPDLRHPQLFMDLSMNLRAIVSMRLVPGRSGKRIPAVEVMLNSPFISDLIKRGEIDQIRDAIERTESSGSKSFDQALYELYKARKISRDEALRHAESYTNLRLKMQLEEPNLRPGLGDLTIDDS